MSRKIPPQWGKGRKIVFGQDALEECYSNGIAQAITEAIKMTHKRLIRLHPETYLGPYAVDYEAAEKEMSALKAGRKVNKRKTRPTMDGDVPVRYCGITFNPPVVHDDNLEYLEYFSMFFVWLTKLKWVDAAFGGVEHAPGTYRPHFHLVVKQTLGQYRGKGDIVSQIFKWARSKKVVAAFGLDMSGHTREHTKVEYLKEEGDVDKALKYICKENLVIEFPKKYSETWDSEKLNWYFHTPLFCHPYEDDAIWRSRFGAKEWEVLETNDYFFDHLNFEEDYSDDIKDLLEEENGDADGVELVAVTTDELARERGKRMSDEQDRYNPTPVREFPNEKVKIVVEDDTEDEDLE